MAFKLPDLTEAPPSSGPFRLPELTSTGVSLYDQLLDLPASYRPPTTTEKVFAAGARIVPPIAGFAIGGPPVSAILGAAGEYAAEKLEHRPANPREIVTAGILSGIPAGRFSSITSKGGRVMLRGVEGAIMGGTGMTATTLAQRGELPSRAEVALGLASGAVLGGASGRVEYALSKRVKALSPEAIKAVRDRLKAAGPEAIERAASDASIETISPDVARIAREMRPKVPPPPVHDITLYGPDGRVVVGNPMPTSNTLTGIAGAASPEEIARGLPKALASSVASTPFMRELADVAKTANIDFRPSGTVRTIDKLLDFAQSNRVVTPAMEPILDRHQITVDQFYQSFRTAIRAGVREEARGLQTLAELSAQIADAIPESQVPVPPSAWKRVAQSWRTFRNSYLRGFAVSQPATAARNALDQGNRAVMEVTSDFLAGAVEKTLSDKVTTREAFAPALSQMSGFLRSMTRDQRAHVATALSQLDDEQALKLFGTVSGDVVAGKKVVDFVNTLNRTQEWYFRRVHFWATQNSEMIRRGLDPMRDAIPQEVIEKGIDSALSRTWANDPATGSLAAQWISTVNRTPILDLIVLFPRFMYNNIRYQLDYNPLRFMQLASPKFIKQLAGGERSAAKAMGQATVGAMMLTTAYALRSNPNTRGPKWYELRVGTDPSGAETTVDMRPFATVVPFMLMAEALRDPSHLTWSDWLEGTASMARPLGSLFWAADVLRSNEPAKVRDFFYDLAGDTLSIAAMPGAAAKDLIAATGRTPQMRRLAPAVAAQLEKESLIKAKGLTSTQTLTEPVLSRIPFAQINKPNAPNPLTGQPLQREGTGLRQMTGLVLRKRDTFLEREVSRLGLDPDVRSRIGLRELDLAIDQRTGDIMSLLHVSDLYEKSKVYENADDDLKRLMLYNGILGAKGLPGITNIRTLAKQVVFHERPDLVARAITEGFEGSTKLGEKIKTFRGLQGLGLLSKETAALPGIPEALKQGLGQ